MKQRTRGTKTRSHRSDASAAERAARRREIVATLSRPQSRAYRGLTDILQTHLTEFES
jgi:hypothetical protein